MADTNRSRTDMTATVLGSLLVVALVVGVLGVGIGLDAHRGKTKSIVTSTGMPAPSKRIDFSAEAAKGFVARDPAAPATPTGTVHEITLRATEKELLVAPGVKQVMWTFNDTVPGPILRGKVGDTFRIRLVNQGTLGHSIDFHASKVAWNDEMRTIDPGKSLIYEFTADHAGIFMYHCGTAPALHHIGNGMYGAVIVDPPDLRPVDHEYALIQSEIYPPTGRGEPADLVAMQQERWDAVVFNGVANQYKDRPIRVEPHESIRVWVLDAGPSENSSFHVVGSIFDRVFKEGAYVLQPESIHGGAQALDLQPAQGGFVEFDLAEAGFYPFVTHKFANVGKGAIGLFQAGDVKMEGGGGH
jgi:nitrite reductase (NO-forming)